MTVLNSGSANKNLNDRETDYLYDNERREMLAFVPETAKFILEVGCGTGRFAALLKERNQATIWGIEQDPIAAKIAAPNLDKMFTLPVGEAFNALQNQKFDAIILLDVLEHLLNPDEVIANLKTLLKEEGVIVCSIPNIRYFHAFRDLVLFGEWEYKESGILDRTHLRFFTFNSINKFFMRLGFKMLRIEGINPTGSIKFKIANALLLNKFWDCKYLQFACVVSPAQQI